MLVITMKDGETYFYHGYYSNSNLNSYVSGVVWLDTGDEVTVLTNADTVPTKDTNVCKDYYVYTSFYFANKLREVLPPAVKELVSTLYPDAYFYGVLGSAIFEKTRQIKTLLEHKNPFSFFEETARYVYQTGSKAQQSYLLGYLAGYTLNSRLSAYIHYFYENGVSSMEDDDKTYLSLEEIKSGIDGEVKKLLSDVELQTLQNLKLCPLVVDEIAELYKNPISQNLGVSVGPIALKLALRKHRFQTSQNPKNYDFLNVKKRSWDSVRNGRWKSDFSFEELTTALVSIGEKMTEGLCNRLFYGTPLEENSFRMTPTGLI